MKQLASTATGIQAVLALINQYDIHPSEDGLEFASPGDLSKWKIDDVTMPERCAFLDDIRVLRRIPLDPVPDPDLLPPESIRFFHVNQTWIDRVIDGVFSNTNICIGGFSRTVRPRRGWSVRPCPPCRGAA